MQSGPGGRREDVLRLKWSAQRLHMGSWTCVSALLNEQPLTYPQAQEELRLCQKRISRTMQPCAGGEASGRRAMGPSESVNRDEFEPSG